MAFSFEHGFVQFGEFFADLGAHVAHVGPVEAHPAGALAELLRARQGWQRPRHIGQHSDGGLRVLRGSRGRPFLGLQFLPRHRRLTEDMRMPPHQLVVDAARNAIEIEPAALLRQLRVEHHLEQQITELIAQLRG